jgi:hypothetical protein
MLARKTPLRRKTPLKRSTKPIPRISKKRAAQVRQYRKAADEYLRENPICEVWLKENGWQKIKGDHAGIWYAHEKTGMWGFKPSELIALGAPPSVEVHHVNKRRGDRLTDKRHFLAVCRANHDRIENNKGWAREQGYLLNF